MTTRNLRSLSNACDTGLGCDPIGCGFCRDIPVEEEVRKFDLDRGRDPALRPVLDTLGTASRFVETQQLGYFRGSAKALDKVGIGMVRFGGVHGTRLNMTFKQKSNVPFNNNLFGSPKINAMSEMHESTRRLYEAAQKLRQVTGQSAVARVLDISPQVLKNWEARGISKQGAIRAQESIGCDVAWLLDGTGELTSKPARELLVGNNVTEIEPKAQVPLISWVRAGNWGEVEDGFHPGEADEWIEVVMAQTSKNAFALRVDGDSMTSPIPGDRSFPDGTIIIVDPGRSANAGDYVIAKDTLTQKATFKRLMYDGGRWFLKPLNPTYPTVEIDDPAIRVIGRVVEFQNRGKL